MIWQNFAPKIIVRLLEKGIAPAEVKVSLLFSVIKSLHAK